MGQEPTLSFLSITKISDILYTTIFDQSIYINIQVAALRVVRNLIEDVCQLRGDENQNKQIQKFLTKALEKHVQKFKQTKNNLKKIKDYIKANPDKGQVLLSPKISSLPKKKGKN